MKNHSYASYSVNVSDFNVLFLLYNVTNLHLERKPDKI